VTTDKSNLLIMALDAADLAHHELEHIRMIGQGVLMYCERMFLEGNQQLAQQAVYDYMCRLRIRRAVYETAHELVQIYR
jgi:hypothetical protein